MVFGWKNERESTVITLKTMLGDKGVGGQVCGCVGGGGGYVWCVPRQE